MALTTGDPFGIGIYIEEIDRPSIENLNEEELKKRSKLGFYKTCFYCGGDTIIEDAEAGLAKFCLKCKSIDYLSKRKCLLYHEICMQKKKLRYMEIEYKELNLFQRKLYDTERTAVR